MCFIIFEGEDQGDGPACGQGRQGTGRSPASPREAALAADLIAASLIRLLVVPGQYGAALLASQDALASLDVLWRPCEAYDSCTQCKKSGAIAYQDFTHSAPSLYCPGTTKRRIKEAVIKSAASAASLRGGCVDSRLDHGFLNLCHIKIYVGRKCSML